MGLKEDAAMTAIDVAGENAPNILGIFFPYLGLERKAVEVYISDIEKSNLPREVKVFLICNAQRDIKRIKNQKAITDIAVNNAREGTDFSEKSKVNEEWIERFIDSAGFVSDEEVQIIWGRILAGEFEHPGSTPPNMTRILSELTPDLAIAFRKVCSMKVYICDLADNESTENGFYKLIVPYKGNMEKFLQMELTFKILNELETIGLIKVDTMGGYVTKAEGLKSVLISCGEKVGIIHNLRNEELPIGNVLFTSAGEVLSKIINVEDLSEIDFYEMLENYFKGHNYELSNEHSFKIEKHADFLRFIKMD